MLSEVQGQEGAYSPVTSTRLSSDQEVMKMLEGAIPYGGQVTVIGDIEVIPVFDGYSREDPTHFYAVHPDAPPQKGDRIEDWDQYRDFLDDLGRLEHGLGGFLIRTGERLVLVDTGVGPTQVGPYGPYNRVIRGGELPQRLADLGVKPDDISDVVITHLHPDHYGWASAEGGALFANATFRCHALDWDHFVTKPGEAISGMAASLKQLERRLETFDHDGPILPGLDTRLAPGHTPGSVILVISSGENRGLLLGDVVHCPVELVDDEWASLGDVDPALARRTKVALARELEGSSIPVAGAHFPGMRFGRLLTSQVNRLWSV
jgi:glyoxylase-like metal-dependent hydrolase (beta-lactamase superfamily II)